MKIDSANISRTPENNPLFAPVTAPLAESQHGGYWQGGVWLPVFYMTMKALNRIGEFELAGKLSRQLLHWMKDCFDQVEPHTIWECYSPTSPMPSTNKKGFFCRRDFCGWSALAPISLFIEDVIGLRSLDAASMTVCWYPPETRGRCGICNLKFDC